MAISASTYRKILSIKTWVTNKLPTVTEDINITGSMKNLTEEN